MFTALSLPVARLMAFWEGYGGEMSDGEPISPLPWASVSTVSLTLARREVTSQHGAAEIAFNTVRHARGRVVSLCGNHFLIHDRWNLEAI